MVVYLKKQLKSLFLTKPEAQPTVGSLV